MQLISRPKSARSYRNIVSNATALKKQKGRLRLDSLNDDFTQTQTAGIWIEVRDNLNLGEMPPEDEPRPEAAQLFMVSKWIADKLKEMHALANSTGGEVQIRRMTRTEYLNTVRDLLKVTFVDGQSPREILPPDGTLEGFDKLSKALLLDPSLMENYFEAAQLVAERAVRLRPLPIPTMKVRKEFEDIFTDRHGRSQEPVEGGIRIYRANLRLGSKIQHPYSSVLQPFNAREVPIRGRYTVRVKAGASRGNRPDEPVYMDINWNRGNTKRVEVSVSPDNPQVYEWTTTMAPDEGGELQVAIVPGTKFLGGNPAYGTISRDANALFNSGKQGEAVHLRGLGRAEGSYNHGGSYRDGVIASSKDRSVLPYLFVDWIETEGPLQEDFPPASTRYIFHQGFNDPAKETPEYVRTIFYRLLPRAFRRLVSDEELAQYTQLVTKEMELGHSFGNALKTGIIAVLCSPDFLYLFEPGHSQKRALNDFELATRLSYFLWSSMPDDELFRLAFSRQLTNRTTLRQQVDRMLADPKSEALVNDFARQWLKINEFLRFIPDNHVYQESYWAPKFGGIGQDIEQEASEFFREILRKNENVLNFLDSRWVMANEKLAAYYGLPPVQGEQFRRINLPPNSPRGGVIGMAGFHLWGGDGARTKPVERGKYILSVLFNDPPDPPPPNAGEVEPNIQGEKLTVRERLLRHQEVEACAGCHKRLDPYGLGMENFNAVGQWRDGQDGEAYRFWGQNPPPIINEGTLPNGTKFSNYNEFKAALAAQGPRFKRGLAEKLLMYALGRLLEPTDDATLQNLVGYMDQNGQTLRALIHGIVQTEAFRTK